MRLVILKKKPWMVKFKVNDTIYFIKQVDGKYAQTLYMYIPTDDNGHYETKPLKTDYSDFNLSDYITPKKGCSFKEINLNNRKFVSQLAWLNFGECVGMNPIEIKAYKTERQKIQCEEKIAALEKELAKWRLQLFILEHPEEYE